MASKADERDEQIQRLAMEYLCEKDVFIRNQLIENLQWLTRHVALKKTIPASLEVRMDRGDLQAELNLSLYAIIERYDPKKQERFSRYCLHTLHQRALDIFRAYSDVPRSVSFKERNIGKLFQDYFAEHGRVPKYGDVRTKIQKIGCTSEDFFRYCNDTLTRPHVVPIEDLSEKPDLGAPVLDALAQEEYDNRLFSYLSRSRSGHILYRCVVDQTKLTEIAQELGISSERVRQLKKQGEKLFQDWSPREYSTSP